MAIDAERKADGSFETIELPTGESHTVVLRTLNLDLRYHDDDPVQRATFVVRFGNGRQASGKLDAQGRARLYGVPAGEAEVRYGPDSRPFQPVKQDDNPDFRPAMSAADIDALIEKHRKA